MRGGRIHGHSRFSFFSYYTPTLSAYGVNETSALTCHDISSLDERFTISHCVTGAYEGYFKINARNDNEKYIFRGRVVGHAAEILNFHSTSNAHIATYHLFRGYFDTQVDLRYIGFNPEHFNTTKLHKSVVFRHTFQLPFQTCPSKLNDIVGYWKLSNGGQLELPAQFLTNAQFDFANRATDMRYFFHECNIIKGEVMDDCLHG